MSRQTLGVIGSNPNCCVAWDVWKWSNTMSDVVIGLLLPFLFVVLRLEFFEV